MKIAICMTYFERLTQLKNTLDSIAAHTLPDEIIIVDDGSSIEPLTKEVIGTIANNLPIKIFRFSAKNKTWTNPSVAYNKAFSLTSEDIDTIIIQNSECYHKDDIVGVCKKNDFTNLYLSFSCYSIPIGSNPKDYNSTEKFLDRSACSPDTKFMSGNEGWYQHSQYHPVLYHYASAISRANLLLLGGFDEGYANGFAAEDDDFSYRVKKLLNCIHHDDHIVLHQYHDFLGCTLDDLEEKHKKNSERYQSLINGTKKDFYSSFQNVKKS